MGLRKRRGRLGIVGRWRWVWWRRRRWCCVEGVRGGEAGGGGDRPCFDRWVSDWGELELFFCSRVFQSLSDGSEWGVGPKNGSEVAGDF